MTFQTRISPGSSSNPLSSQSACANGGGGGINASAIPLGVVISQTLVRHLAETWVLECEFAFDFHPPAHGGVDAARPAPSDRPNNGHNGGNGEVGKKFSVGLGQYFMSNAVKGTTVNMAILLGEGDDATANEDSPASMTTAIDGGDVKNGGASQCWHDGMMSCLVHPLLLPPDGMCSPTSGGGGRSIVADDAMHGACGAGEPSRIGASLLLAIRVRNALCCGDSLEGPAPPPDASLARGG